MAGNGNLLVKKLTNTNGIVSSGSETLWSSGTQGNAGENRACLRNNNNFVILSESDSVLWNTNTAGSGGGSGECSLKMQGNGNLLG